MQTAPPETDWRNMQVNYCSLPRRLLVILYDSVVLLGLLMLASAIALPFGNTQKIAFQNIGFTLWLLLVCFLYLGGCWHYGGTTVGMRAWRVRLISNDGKVVSWTSCGLRFLVGLVSLAIFGLGVFWAVVDKKNRGWHDLAAHTLVVKCSG